jgi:hypothetical protein
VTPFEYWQECITTAAEECDLPLLRGQLLALAESAESAHENYGMFSYDPGGSAYIQVVEDQYKRQLRDKDNEHEKECNSYVETIKDLRWQIADLQRALYNERNHCE